MRGMNRLLILVAIITPVVCTGQDWLRQVSPIMSSAEKARYRSLSPSEQAAFPEQFLAEQGYYAG